MKANPISRLPAAERSAAPERGGVSPAGAAKRSKPTRIAYWLQAELVAMATDLAEVVGGAIALNLLFHLPLLVGGIITGVVSLLLLVIQDRRGQRVFERVIMSLCQMLYHCSAHCIC